MLQSMIDIIYKNFCFDTYVLITKNMNLFSLERKISDQSKCEMIYMFWKEYVSVDFYKFSIVYPDIYCSSEKRGFNLKSEYLIVFK